MSASGIMAAGRMARWPMDVPGLGGECEGLEDFSTIRSTRRSLALVSMCMIQPVNISHILPAAIGGNAVGLGRVGLAVPVRAPSTLCVDGNPFNLVRSHGWRLVMRLIVLRGTLSTSSQYSSY